MSAITNQPDHPATVFPRVRLAGTFPQEDGSVLYEVVFDGVAKPVPMQAYPGGRIDFVDQAGPTNVAGYFVTALRCQQTLLHIQYQWTTRATAEQVRKALTEELEGNLRAIIHAGWLPVIDDAPKEQES